MAASAETVPEYPKLLRARSDIERELSTWTPLTTCPHQHGFDVKNCMTPPEQVYLFSLSSGPEWVHLDFVNTTDDDVTLIWLNFCGAEVAYGLIPPKQQFDIWSFKTHPWIARQGTTADGARLMLGESMVIFPEAPTRKVPITRPPLLTWSLKTHKHFPGAFKDGVKQLLLSHHRLCKIAAGSPSYFSPHMITRNKAVMSAERSLDALTPDLLLHIASFMAPLQRQCITLLPDGHPDIAPAQLPYDPSTRTGACVGCGGSHTAA